MRQSSATAMLLNWLLRLVPTFARRGARRASHWARTGGTLAAILGLVGPALATGASAIAVAPGVYALPGEGGEVGWSNDGHVANIAFVVGPRGVVVVDSGASRRQGDEIIAAVAAVTRQPIRLLVLTHAAQEVVFGAAAFQARGIPVLMSRASADLMAARCEGCLRTLNETLGEDRMSGSRVVHPDRLLDRAQTLHVIGRPLRILLPAGPQAPGTLAVLDPQTRTLIAGNLVSVDRVPDLRDFEGRGWRPALAQLAATRCRHLVPAYGRLGSCDDIASLDRYFAALEASVRELLRAGVGLAELPARCDLPGFATWDRYPDLHVQNANRAYLRLERALFLN